MRRPGIPWAAPVAFGHSPDMKAVITGASSGIGEALAHELAARGYDLGLTARRIERLQEIEEQIRGDHPDLEVAVAQHDVTETDTTPGIVAELSAALGGLDVVVVNAGIGGSGRVGSGCFAQAREVVEVNLIGAMATVDAAVAQWREGGRRGHIVGISSVAGFRGLPGSAAYSASKAGLSTYLEAVRAEVAGDGIAVTILSPGYIDTPINQSAKKRPFLISVEDGARKIAEAIEKQRLHATVPGWPWAGLGFVMRHLPDRLWLRMTRR